MEKAEKWTKFVDLWVRAGLSHLVRASQNLMCTHCPVWLQRQTVALWLCAVLMKFSLFPRSFTSTLCLSVCVCVCTCICPDSFFSFFFHLLYTLLYFYAAICAACKHTQTPDLMLLCSLWCFVTFIIRSWRKALHLSLLFANDNLKLELELESDFIRFECEHK